MTPKEKFHKERIEWLEDQLQRSQQREKVLREAMENCLTFGDHDGHNILDTIEEALEKVEEI